MFIKMKFIFGVSLLTIQLFLAIALDRDQCEDTYRCGSKEADKIIIDIMSRRFEDAVNKIQMLNGDVRGTMNCIVYTVYAHDVSNFNRILQLVDAKNTETLNLAIYEALYSDMNESKHKYHLVTAKRSLELMKSFNSINFTGSFNFDPQNSELSRVKGELQKIVHDLVDEELTKAILSKNSDSIATISAAIGKNYPELFGELIVRIVNGTFDQIDKRYLAMFFLNHTDFVQSIKVYSAVLNEYKRRNDFNHSEVVLFASGVSESVEKALFYGDGDNELMPEIWRLKELLPSSVERIAFGRSYMCIKNKEKGEFMFADGAYGEGELNTRRTVHTTKPGTFPVDKGWWSMERHGDTYRISSVRDVSVSEYLMRSLIKSPPVREHGSYPFTWIPGGTNEDAKHHFDWTFEPHGDYVYIRNEYRQEYLYASDVIPGDKKDWRFVYVDQGQRVPGSLWKIVTCPILGSKPEE